MTWNQDLMAHFGLYYPQLECLENIFQLTCPNGSGCQQSLKSFQTNDYTIEKKHAIKLLCTVVSHAVKMFCKLNFPLHSKCCKVKILQTRFYALKMFCKLKFLLHSKCCKLKFLQTKSYALKMFCKLEFLLQSKCLHCKCLAN